MITLLILQIDTLETSFHDIQMTNCAVGNSIDFRDTGAFPKIILDYLEDKETIQPYYKYPMNMSSFQTIIEDKTKAMINRKLLVDILEKQHNQLPHNEQVMQNIHLLMNPDTYTVTTGHQLNIFTGPVYCIYKIVSTINLAKKISEENPRIKVVPVYWMASEDHDFAEINHINLFKKTIVWHPETNIEGAVGRIDISNNIENTIKEVKSILGISEYALQLSSIIEEAYLKNVTLAEATRYFVHQLFHDQGLIILNADNHDFKKVFAEIIEHDILTKQSFNYVNETIQQMKINYKIQAKPREINFFYLLDNYRTLIVTDGDQYKTNDNKYIFTKEQLQQEIKIFPERFSPNVLMRPLYQELLLPNLAYIGGPNELAYWLELRTMFESYNVNFPMLVLRSCALIIDDKTFELMKKFHLSIPDLFLPIDQIIKSFVIQSSNDEISLKEEISLIEQSFAQILEKAVDFDSSLKGLILTEKSKILKTLNTLEKKLFKAKKKTFENEIEQLKKIKDNLFPTDDLQERHDNFMKFYLRKGDQYLRDLINILEPLS
jgi:bacillithiol biosynthesis cysteine-adding enzyme BshC